MQRQRNLSLGKEVTIVSENKKWVFPTELLAGKLINDFFEGKQRKK